MDYTRCPIIGLGIARDGPQPGQAGIVQAEEEAALLRHTAVGEGRVVEAEFAYALLLLNVVEHREDMVRLGVAVVEEELGVGRVGVPVKHGALLEVPGAGFFNLRDTVVVVGVEEDDIGGFAC